MNIDSLKLVYFSPTGTTKQVVTEIGKGLQAEHIEVIDCTRPERRAEMPPDFHDELVILGAPVYAGRVPDKAARCFAAFTARNTPVIPVVVYGNREYEDALKELRDIALKAGFTPVAAGVFIGEHSFSTEKLPIAAGRPDTEDLRTAQEFGTNIWQKLRHIERLDEIAPLNIPGKSPYRREMSLPKTAPATNKELCIQCGKCTKICPTAAINRDDASQTDKYACILCCACIKTCPKHARVLRHLLLRFMTRILNRFCRKRKEPELYL